MRSGKLNKSEETRRAYKITDVGITLRRKNLFWRSRGRRRYSWIMERWGLKRNNTTEQGLPLKAYGRNSPNQFMQPKGSCCGVKSRHLSSFWDKWVQSTASHPVPFLRSILILYSHLCLALVGDSILHVSQPKPYMHLLCLHVCRMPHLFILPNLITLTLFS